MHMKDPMGPYVWEQKHNDVFIKVQKELHCVPDSGIRCCLPSCLLYLDSLKPKWQWQWQWQVILAK